MLLQTPYRRVCISQHLPVPLPAAQSDVSPNLHGTHRPRTLLADDSRVARTHNPAVEQAGMTRGARGGTTGIALARARASPWPLAARAAFFLARIHRSGGRRCEDCGRATPPRAYDRAPGGARAECRRETSARLRTPAHACARGRATAAPPSSGADEACSRVAAPSTDGRDTCSDAAPPPPRRSGTDISEDDLRKSVAARRRRTARSCSRREIEASSISASGVSQKA